MERTGDDGADFDALIARALERLPSGFRASLASVAIVVDDYPTEAQLRSHGVSPAEADFCRNAMQCNAIQCNAMQCHQWLAV